jgi:hypothetical protein
VPGFAIVGLVDDLQKLVDTVVLPWSHAYIVAPFNS